MSKEEDVWCYYSGMPSPNAYNKTKMIKVNIKFPNDDQYFEIDINKLDDFKQKNDFEKCVFGWWDNTYIEVLKEKDENGNYINLLNQNKDERN